MALDMDALKSGMPSLTDHSLKFVFNIWLDRLEADGAIPRKSDILPFRIARCLSKIWLYRHLPRQRDFESRVIGEDVLKAWSIRLGRGDRLSRLTENDFYNKMYPRWERIVTEPCIMHAVSEEMGDVAPAERLAMPLADDDGHVCYLLGITQFYEIKDHQLPINPDTEHLNYYEIPVVGRAA